MKGLANDPDREQWPWSLREAGAPLPLLPHTPANTLLYTQYFTTPFCVLLYNKSFVSQTTVYIRVGSFFYLILVDRAGRHVNYIFVNPSVDDVWGLMNHSVD